MPVAGERISLIHSLPKPEKDFYIYALCEPNSINVRYIGLATTGFNRIKHHHKNGGNWTAKKKWIRSITNEKKIFNVIYLEYFNNDGPHLDEAEIKWIKHYTDLGIKLLNHTLGGRRDYLRFNEQQRKERLVHQSQEAKQMFSTKSKEMWAQPGFKEEMKKIKAEINSSPEFRKKCSEGLIKSVGLKIQDDLGNIYNSGQECADALGVKKPGVYRAIRKGYLCKGRKLTYLSGGRNETLSPMWTEYKKKGTPTGWRIPLKDSNGIEYIHAKDAAEKLGVSVSHINKILKTKEVSSILGITLEKLPKQARL